MRHQNHDRFRSTLKTSPDPPRSALRNRLFFESANDAIFLMKDDRFIDCNRKTLRMFRCRQSEIIGKTPYDFSPPLQPDGMNSKKKVFLLLSDLGKKRSRIFEWQHQRSDGSLFDAEVSLNTFTVDKEQYIQAIVRDITKRNQIEAELNERLRFETLITRLSAQFMKIPADKLDREIEKALKQITRFFGAGRCVIIQPQMDGANFNITHEFITKRDNKFPKTKDLAKKFEYIIRLMAERKTFQFSSLNEIPEKEVKLRSYFKTRDIKSFVAVPMAVTGKIIGSLTIAIYDVETAWPPDIVNRVRLLGEIIGSAIIRKQSEKTLLERDAMLTALINAPTESAILVDPNGIILAVNEIGAARLGKKQEKLIGLNILNSLPPHLIHTGTTMKHQIRKIKKPVWFENENKGWTFDTYIYPVLDSCKRIQYIAIYSRDITKQKKIETSLRFTLDFENLISGLSTHFINMPPDQIEQAIHNSLQQIGEFVHVDRSYVFQFNPDGIHMDNTHEWCGPGIRSFKDKLQNLRIDDYYNVREFIRKKNVFKLKCINDLPPEAEMDQTEFSREGIQSILAVPLSDGKNAIGFIGFDSVSSIKNWEDISVRLLQFVGEMLANAILRKKNDTLLHESEQRFRAFSEASFEGIAITQQGKMIDGNPRISEMLGYSLSELQGMRVVDLVAPDDRDMVHEKIASGSEVRYIHKALRKDGEIIFVEVCGRSIQYQGKSCRITVLRDITDFIRTETALRHSLKEKMLLLKEVHHRVKNNFQVISSLLNLQMNHLDPKFSEVFNILRENQNRIQSMALIHENLYHAENFTNINFEEYISNLVRTLYQSYKVSQSQIKLSVNIDKIPLGIDNAIPCGLIINEIITNALEHAFPEHRKGHIWIVMHQKGDHNILLNVRDDGIGFQKDLDISRSNTLGLYLIKMLTEYQLHGSIRINTEKGTQFIIQFPVE